MLYFDHCFTRDPNYKMMRRLERLGFTLEASTVEHPGKMFSRFIMLASADSPRKKHYLEFIHIKQGGDPMPWPGISFGYSKNLESFHSRLQKRMKNTSFFHKNYDWKTDEQSRLPGWNFVDFKKLGFTGLFPFMTEYEPKKKKTNRLPAPKHPNGVRQVHALIFDVNPAAKKFFTSLLDKQRKLECGTLLILNDAKRTRFRQVVLRCKNLKRFMTDYPAGELTEWNGQPAARIENPAKMWDLIII